MKYIRERNGKREIVEKRKHSKAYVMQTAVKWSVCIIVLLLIVLLLMYLDKKLDDGRIMNKIINSVTDASAPADVTTEENIPADTETQAEAEEHTLTVCLDPGHGGMDPGSDFEGRLESEDNWKLALAVKENMEAQGIKVIMTREDNNTKVFLKDRVAIANASDADYFISIHRNSGDGYGLETWQTANGGAVSEQLTQNIHNAIVNVGVQRDRGVKMGTDSGEGSDYYVIGNTKMPACLLEFGFVNNTEDNRLFEEHLQDYAKAITQAVADTYAAQGAGQEDEQIPAGEAGTETGAQGASVGMTLNNEPIDNVSALSGETLDWGQGGNVDEQNRPTGCLSYQEKFKEYSADFIIPTSEKKIYLTFDEGYEYGCTPSILSTLKEKEVKAVFFVTKPYVEQDEALVRQMIDEGHIVGNHSVNHPASGLPSESLEEQKQEIMGNHEYVKQKFGYDMFLFRFPAGKFSEQSLAVVNNAGYRSAFWSFAYLDYDVNNQPNEAESLQKLLDRLHPGAIYLLHAESWTNTNILGDFIDKAKEAGYEFGIYSDTIKK